MKRTVAPVLFILIFALCLSFCACGHSSVQEPSHTPKPSPEPAEFVFDHDAVQNDGTGSDAEPAPSIEEVEITADNLLDYFEIVKDRTEKRDKKGKLCYLFISRRLALKKEYILADQEEYPTDVTVDFEYDSKFICYRKPCTINYKNFTATGKVWSQDQTHEVQTAHFPFSPSLDTSWADADPDNKNSPSVVSSSSNFKILNAGGRLYLVEK